MSRNILIISQVIPQWYVDLLTKSLGPDSQIDIITGSNVHGRIIKSPTFNSSSFKSRLVSWYRFYRFVTKWAARNTTKYDLIFATSNPPINSAIGLKLKKNFGAPFVFMSWDLYPQVIRAAIHNPVATVVCRAWSSWNARNYPKIDRILTIGSVMASSIKADINKNIDVRVIPIGVDTEQMKPIAKQDNLFCIQNGLIDQFVVLYSGKMGIGHNIEMILSAAESLKDHEDITFIFIGEGPKYKIVEEYEKRLKNIKLFPWQSDDIFPFSMACGDIGIVTQEISMSHLFMPSKVYSMMACGEAVIGICTGNDDLSALIKEEGIGLTVTDDEPNTLRDKILTIYSDESKRNCFNGNSRKVAVEKYDLSVIKGRYSDLFAELI